MKKPSKADAKVLLAGFFYAVGQRGLLFPVPSSFDCVDSSDTNAEEPRKFGHTVAMLKKHPDHQNMSLIEYGSSVSRPFIGLMLDRVIDVFLRQSVCKVCCGVVVAIAIQVPNNISIGSWAVKSLCHDLVNGLGRLAFVLRPLFKGNCQVAGRRVWLSDKPFSVFDSRNATKATDFIPNMPYNWHPNLGTV